MSPTRRAIAIAGMSAAWIVAGVAMAGAPAHPIALPPPAWTIDRAASRVSLTLSQGAPVQGAFKRWTAQAAFDPARPEQAKVTLSIEAASLVTGDPARDQALTGPSALGAARAPHIVFATRTVTPRPGGGFDAAGELTVAGAHAAGLGGPALQPRPHRASARPGAGAAARRLRRAGAAPADLRRPHGPALRARTVSAKGSSVEAAVAALSAGRLVILPTETVYGLAADAANATAVAALYAAKGRPSFNPLIAHVCDLDAAERIARFDERARTLAARFWPGPLTLVLPAREGVSDLARAGLETVAVRAPAHPVAQAVLRAFGGPVAAPSANRSGRPSPTTFADAMAETGAATAAALDGGPCDVGLESAVVALLDGPPRLLRPGGVTRAELQAQVGPLAEADDDAIRSPGRLALHYAPEAPVRLDAEGPREGEAYLAFGPGGGPTLNLSPSGDLAEAAANLFRFLRLADARRPTAIAVAPIPDEGLGEAINDRLRRAAGYVG